MREMISNKYLWEIQFSLGIRNKLLRINFLKTKLINK